MTEADIADALRARLATTPGRPTTIVWENQAANPTAPYWVVGQVKSPAERLGLHSAHTLTGRLVVGVLVPEGTYTATAEAQAEAIIAHFPTDLSLTAGGGEVIVIARPHADDGYHDGAYWRVNVHIRWQAVIG